MNSSNFGGSATAAGAKRRRRLQRRNSFGPKVVNQLEGKQPVSNELPIPPAPELQTASNVVTGTPEVPRSVRLSAYLCFGLAAVLGIAACVIIASFGQMDISGMGGRAGGMMALGLLLATVVAYCIAPLFLLTFSVLGVGLLRRWRWAYWTTIVLAGLYSLVTFPVGLIFGLPIIILLMQPDAKRAFQKID